MEQAESKHVIGGAPTKESEDSFFSAKEAQELAAIMESMYSQGGIAPRHVAGEPAVQTPMERASSLEQHAHQDHGMGHARQPMVRNQSGCAGVRLRVYGCPSPGVRGSNPGCMVVHVRMCGGPNPGAWASMSGRAGVRSRVHGCPCQEVYTRLIYGMRRLKFQKFA
jgi:hypothetical protein